jgi:hypothetical protein
MRGGVGTACLAKVFAKSSRTRAAAGRLLRAVRSCWPPAASCPLAENSGLSPAGSYCRRRVLPPILPQGWRAAGDADNRDSRTGSPGGCRRGIRRAGRALEREIARLGSSLGPPWTSDQKNACLAAFAGFGREMKSRLEEFNPPSSWPASTALPGTTEKNSMKRFLGSGTGAAWLPACSAPAT